MSSTVDGSTAKVEARDAELLACLRENGYVDIKFMPDGSYAGLFQFMYSWGVVAGLHMYGYEDRWCFHGYDKAKAALDAWDGEDEPQGWHRHLNSGRRRDEAGNEVGRW